MKMLRTFRTAGVLRNPRATSLVQSTHKLSSTAKINLSTLYENILDSHFQEMYEKFCNVPNNIGQDQFYIKGNELFVAKNGSKEFIQQNTMPHPREQGAILHGYMMLREKFRNFVRSSPPVEDIIPSTPVYISRRHDTPEASSLVLRGPGGKMVRLSELKADKLTEILGEPTAKLVIEYNKLQDEIIKQQKQSEHQDQIER